MLKRAKDLYVPVVLNSLLDDYADLSAFNDVRAQSVANGIGMPIVTWSTSFQTVRNAMLQEVLNGADPEEALNKANDKLLEEIENAGK